MEDGRMSVKCIDHLAFLNAVCPDCGLPVDGYGNTEDQQTYCCFPDCGCDGQRLCCATEGPSEYAVAGNVEGMWSGKTQEQRDAAAMLTREVHFAARMASMETTHD
jgi:hypothetical protein